MFLSIAIATGASLVSWLLFVSGRYLYRTGEGAGFVNGYKAARNEYRDTIRAQKMKLIKYESDNRAIKEGDQEWVFEFNKATRGKIIKVDRLPHGVAVEFQRPGDEKPLTGTITHVTVIVPESAQEC